VALVRCCRGDVRVINGEETRFAPTAWKRTHNVTKIPGGQQGQPAHFRARNRYGYKKRKVPETIPVGT